MLFNLLTDMLSDSLCICPLIRCKYFRFTVPCTMVWYQLEVFRMSKFEPMLFCCLNPFFQDCGQIYKPTSGIIQKCSRQLFSPRGVTTLLCTCTFRPADAFVHALQIRRNLPLLRNFFSPLHNTPRQ